MPMSRSATHRPTWTSSVMLLPSTQSPDGPCGQVTTTMERSSSCATEAAAVETGRGLCRLVDYQRATTDRQMWPAAGTHEAERECQEVRECL